MYVQYSYNIYIYIYFIRIHPSIHPHFMGCYIKLSLTHNNTSAFFNVCMCNTYKKKIKNRENGKKKKRSHHAFLHVYRVYDSLFFLKYSDILIPLTSLSFFLPSFLSSSSSSSSSQSFPPPLNMLLPQFAFQLHT